MSFPAEWKGAQTNSLLSTLFRRRCERSDLSFLFRRSCWRQNILHDSRIARRRTIFHLFAASPFFSSQLQSWICSIRLILEKVGRTLPDFRSPPAKGVTAAAPNPVTTRPSASGTAANNRGGTDAPSPHLQSPAQPSPSQFQEPAPCPIRTEGHVGSEPTLSATPAVEQQAAAVPAQPLVETVAAVQQMPVEQTSSNPALECPSTLLPPAIPSVTQIKELQKKARDLAIKAAAAMAEAEDADRIRGQAASEV